MKKDAFEALRLTAYKQHIRLKELGLVNQTFGNASAADAAAGVFAIKPSGVSYSELKPELMVIVDFDGKTVAGNLRPSSDTPTHAILYRHWSDIGGIVHTHSVYGTAWAQSMRTIPVYGTTHADSAAVDIPCIPFLQNELIATNYERNTGMQIINHFNGQGLDYHEVEMALVGGHAPFTWGSTAEQAVENSAALEYIAKLAYLTEQIRPATRRLKRAIIEKHHRRKHGPASYYGQQSVQTVQLEKALWFEK